MRLGWAGILFLLCLPLAAGQSTGGDLYLADALVVGPGETLRLEPGTVVRGPGHIVVQGVLEANGTREAPIELRVPIAFVGNGSSRIESARIANIAGAALTLQRGELLLVNVSLVDNLAGVVVRGEDGARLDVRNATFERHGDAAVRVAGAAEVNIEGSAFLANVLGVAAFLDSPYGANVSVERSLFHGNAEHVRLDFRAGEGTGEAQLAENSFLGPQGSLVFVSLLGAGESESGRRIVLESNLVQDATFGLVARGGGFSLTSRNDTFENNGVAISADASTIHLEGTRFSSRERDLDLGPDTRVTFADVVFTPVPNASPTKPSPWPLLLGGALAGSAGVAAYRARRNRREARRRSTRDAAGEGPPPDPAPAGASGTERLANVSPLELRILHDVAAHPDSAQTAIALRLGLTRQALHYHVKKLVAAGLVIKTARGRTTECRLAPGIKLPPLPPAVTQQDALEKE